LVEILSYFHINIQGVINGVKQSQEEVLDKFRI